MTRSKYMKTYNSNYSKTINGVIRRIYSQQVSKSKRRNHLSPSYNVDEFIKWCYGNNIIGIYNTWVESNYQKQLKPSVDRIDDTIGYTFDNIRLITWGENSSKAHLHQSIGLLKSGSNLISVNQYDLNWNFIATFKSIREASRVTGISRNCIMSCLKTNTIMRKKFNWKLN